MESIEMNKHTWCIFYINNCETKL